MVQWLVDRFRDRSGDHVRAPLTHSLIMQFSTRQYNALERAITERMRIAIIRRGNEFVVLPERISLKNGRETLDTVQPATGDHMSIFLDEIDGFEIVGS